MYYIRRLGFTLTIDDFFCGMGGESAGARSIGLCVRNAFNHWELAIEVHNLNHPDALHHCADIGTYDVYSYRPSEMAWFSPECKTHSMGAGISQYKIGQPALPGFDQYDLTPAQERSRVTAGDVLRHVQAHRYEAIVVENVVGFRRWEKFDNWIAEMIRFGYNYEIVYLNSMFTGTPQSRDRMYTCFWRTGNRAPDLDIKPAAHCPHCNRDVNAVQAWNPNRTVPYGIYGQQYVYNCPCCYREIVPHHNPAAEVIDLANVGTRIGDRKRPLSPNTIRRIENGLKRYGGDDHFIASYQRRDAAASSIAEPLPTITAGGNRHALITPFIATYYGQAGYSRVDEPLPTVTCKPHHGFIGQPAPNVEDCHYRMLTPYELKLGMGFHPDYKTLGNQAQQIEMTGNAVTPGSAAELLYRMAQTLE